MKLALIFLAIFVAISHQQHYHNPRMMFSFPWLSLLPFPNHPAFYNDYENGDVYPVFNQRNSITADEEGEEFEDNQSRVKGISRYRPRPSFQEQQNARFLFNLFATTTGTFNNPLLKTATFTLTQTLSLVSIQSCVPATQVLGGALAVACRRKRSAIEDSMEDSVKQDDQFSIIPSETLKLMPTALSLSQDQSLDLLSSKDDENKREMWTPNHHIRDKRFFINKNQFIVSSTLTSYAFVNSTVTVTRNLLDVPPAAGVQCAAAACVACLPNGFIVCPVPG